MPPPRLTRALGYRDLVVYGLLFIGPLAPVGVFGVLDARTGGAVALVYLLATVAMGLTAWSYAEMSRVVPHAGSVFAYASAGLGPLAGFLAGWLAMLDYLLIPSVAYLFSGIALHALVPSVPAWAFTVAAFAVTATLNLRGVGVAARVGTVVLVAEILVLLVFLAAAAAMLAADGPARPWLSPLLGLGTLDTTAVAGAISVAVLSFLGFDAIAGFAEENAGEARDVGLAILACLVAAGLAFIAQAWLAALVSSTEPVELARQPERQGTAFYDTVGASIGPWLATVLAATKAVGPAFAAMTGQAAAARLLFGMARDGRLPSWLAQVDERRGVPHAALAVAALLTLAVSVWAARRSDGLEVLVSIVDVGALSAFALLHASVPAYFLTGRAQGVGRRLIAHGVVPALGLALTLWVVAGASPLAQGIGAIWAAFGLVAAWSRRGRPDAGALLE